MPFSEASCRKSISASPGLPLLRSIPLAAGRYQPPLRELHGFLELAQQRQRGTDRWSAGVRRRVQRRTGARPRRGDAGSAQQAGLTSDYGFANFFANSGVVDLARAVAVAETAGAANDQNAVVRLRQNGEDTVAVSFYRVDDHSGKIGTFNPGDSGYAAAAQARLYAMKEGSTAVDGAGYGLYTEAQITHVNAGDLIAMQLTNKTSGNVYWAFSQANETVGSESVGHLWSYGANTWGWEDTHGGGDRDFNDLVVQLDFTSASGSGWLV